MCVRARAHVCTQFVRACVSVCEVRERGGRERDGGGGGGGGGGGREGEREREGGVRVSEHNGPPWKSLARTPTLTHRNAQSHARCDIKVGFSKCHGLCNPYTL